MSGDQKFSAPRFAAAVRASRTGRPLRAAALWFAFARRCRVERGR